MAQKGKEKGGSAGKLLKTTSVYMIGSMLSKLLNLVMLPYISSQLDAAQYGVYDLIQTIVSVALPVFTFQAIEAAFRFVYLAKGEEKGRVITNVWLLITGGSAVFALGLWALNGAYLHLAYAKYLLIYYVFNVLINMFQRIARCYDNNKVYALSGVIQTFVMLTVQYAFLRFLSMKEDGLVYAYAISCIVACVYIECSVRSLRALRLRYISRETIMRIVRFSAPLIPNSVSWWAVSSVNRVIIVSFLGYAANGIFSMANKFASIVTMIASTFQLAWQEYGLVEKDNPRRRELFSQVFSHFLIVLSCVTAGGILLQQIFFKALIDPEYAESFLYIPIVMISVALSSMNSFYGAGYFIYERTTGAFKTTIVGAALNLALCFVTVRPLGLYGVALSGAIAYLAMWIIRCVTMRSYFRIDVRLVDVLWFVLMVGLSILVYYRNNNLYSAIAILAVCALFVLRYGKMALGFLAARKK